MNKSEGLNIFSGNLASLLDETEWLNIFSGNLASLLDETGMTQRELSEATGISKGTINKYINKRQFPNVINIIKIARALDCDPSELIDFE